MTDKTFIKNFIAMIIFSIALIYFTFSVTELTKLQTAYMWGFIFGRALASTLFSLALVSLPLFIVQRKQLKFGKASYIVWWGLLITLNVLLILTPG